MTIETDLPYRPCVGVMLINREGRVFVGKRSDAPLAPEGTGRWWQMPQGGLDQGEDPEEAARRELHEETGVTRARIIGRTRRWYNYDLPQGLVGTAWHGRYRGQTQLMDYSATKGAIVSLTRSLSQNLAAKGIRVNAVAPGPIWTPLIPASFDADKVAEFGQHVPLGRAGQPNEVAPCFLFLACEDSSYMTGQVLHPNGGEMVGS